MFLPLYFYLLKFEVQGCFNFETCCRLLILVFFLQHGDEGIQITDVLVININLMPVKLCPCGLILVVFACFYL